MSRSQSVTIGASSPAAQSGSWSRWCGSRASPDGAERHHPATGLAVGEVPDVARDRAARARVGQPRHRARCSARSRCRPTPVAAAPAASRQAAATSNACTGVTTWVAPQDAGCPAASSSAAVASARRSSPYGVPAATSDSRARPTRPATSSHGREHRVVGDRLGQRREHRLGGEPQRERGAPGGERGGTPRVGLHPAVPVEDRGPHRRPGRAGLEAAHEVLEHRRRQQQRVVVDVAEVGGGQVVRGRRAAGGCGPRGAAARTTVPIGVALRPAPLVGGHHLAVGRDVVPRQRFQPAGPRGRRVGGVDDAAAVGVGRTGTRPATR